MKILKMLSLAAVMVMAASCSTEDKEGDWEPFKWNQNEYKNVSADGATVVSILKNYDTCWLTNTSMDGILYYGGSLNAHDEEDSTAYTYDNVTRYNYKNPRLDVKIQGQRVYITVAPNPDPVPHKFSVGLSLMNCSGPGITIEQEAHE